MSVSLNDYVRDNGENNMKFYSVIEKTSEAAESESLEKEYKEAREFGVVRVGASHLFFRAKLKHYFIPYTAIYRCFRRVLAVPARMCCGRGDFEMENLVICGEGDVELVQIQLPGKRAAQELMKEIRFRMPNGNFSVPPKKENAEEAGK